MNIGDGHKWNDWRTVIDRARALSVVVMPWARCRTLTQCWELLDQADEALGFALSDVIANGPESELTRTDLSQPAILVVSVMSLAVLKTDAFAELEKSIKDNALLQLGFDPVKDAVPFDQLLEVDRYALSRAAQLQAEVLAHYEVYEFHPVVSKLQIYCSEDLGAFYLDVLKDRLYTTAPKSLARRSAQTALYRITHGMLRWMAPFLSFTAEEAWSTFGQSESIFLETFSDFGAADAALLTKWARIREIRDLVNKDIENLRSAGQVGASLQAEITLTAPAADHALVFDCGEILWWSVGHRSDHWRRYRRSD